MYATKRSGFAMILAIFVVVLIALGGVMILGGTSIGNKAAGNNYLKAQAELLAESATEFAVMQAQGQPCLTTLTINVNDSTGVQLYDIAVRMHYSYSTIPFPGGCTGADVLNTVGTGHDSMILVDTTVTTNAAANLSTEPIRVHKRSWQKL